MRSKTSRGIFRMGQVCDAVSAILAVVLSIMQDETIRLLRVLVCGVTSGEVAYRSLQSAVWWRPISAALIPSGRSKRSVHLLCTFAVDASCTSQIEANSSTLWIKVDNSSSSGLPATATYI